MRPPLRPSLVVAACLAFLACGRPTIEPDGGDPDGGLPAGPGVDDDGGVDLLFGTWNLEWFGDPSYGPTNEALQYQNVKGVIADAGVDLLAVEEVCDNAKLHQLVSELPGYDAVIVGDPIVDASSNYIGSQRVGLVFHSDVVQVLSASIILVNQDYDFGYRPPLRADLRLTKDGQTLDLVAIVLHMKAYATASDWTRRHDAAVALKSYLDTSLPSTPVLVMGDWNDDIDVSIVSGYPTPYANFVGDPAHFTYVTQPLTAAGLGSTVGRRDVIDHLMATDEAAARSVRKTSLVVRPDLWPVPVPSYKSTTTDHYPVQSRLRLAPVP